MGHILVINPNASTACCAGIEAAIAPLRFPGGPSISVTTAANGPPAVYSWRDWHAAVGPVCRIIETTPSDAYVVACASDPGIEAARAVTGKPVFGVFRCAVAAAVARAERFGVIAIVEASKARHMLALRSMGLADRLAGEAALNVTMDELLDPDFARARLIAAGRALKDAGAGAIVLGCTGMAHHRGAMADEVGLPVIEPCQAAVAQAICGMMS